MGNLEFFQIGFRIGRWKKELVREGAGDINGNEEFVKYNIVNRIILATIIYIPLK
jgi:hypothetical protein